MSRKTFKKLFILMGIGISSAAFSLGNRIIIVGNVCRNALAGNPGAEHARIVYGGAERAGIWSVALTDAGVLSFARPETFADRNGQISVEYAAFIEQAVDRVGRKNVKLIELNLPRYEDAHHLAFIGRRIGADEFVARLDINGRLRIDARGPRPAENQELAGFAQFVEEVMAQLEQQFGAGGQVSSVEFDWTREVSDGDELGTFSYGQFMHLSSGLGAGSSAMQTSVGKVLTRLGFDFPVVEFNADEPREKYTRPDKLRVAFYRDH